jgi:hypothetical protein
MKKYDNIRQYTRIYVNIRKNICQKANFLSNFCWKLHKISEKYTKIYEIYANKRPLYCHLLLYNPTILKYTFLAVFVYFKAKYNPVYVYFCIYAYAY